MMREIYPEDMESQRMKCSYKELKKSTCSTCTNMLTRKAHYSDDYYNISYRCRIGGFPIQVDGTCLNYQYPEYEFVMLPLLTRRR